MSPDDCAATLRGAKNMRSILCARPWNGQSVYFGDSGGPLLRERDGKLIGTMSFVQMDETYESVELQVFTNIFFYFDWIAQVTQLDMPECSGPQAIIATDDDEVPWKSCSINAAILKLFQYFPHNHFVFRYFNH